ncbi:MAG TPA: DUF6305 family protein [Bacillota bacterium]|nr:DUF6305 family protein [Bacillota bacterium]
MKKRFIGYLLILGLLLAGVVSFHRDRPAKSLLPHLPAPIAREKALVTPAGQGQESLIVAELCDKLNVNNNFMFWAEPTDLAGFNSLILVLGFSKQGLFSMHRDAEEEISRVKLLTEAAKQKKLPIVLIHLGGTDRRGGQNDKAATAIANNLDYIIVTESGEKDGFFRELAAKNDVPITIVHDVPNIKVPLNSVYR